MPRAAQKVFLLTWKTNTSKYQIVRGPAIADACNNAGIGRGALPALDLYVDVTAFFKKGMPFKVLKIVHEWAKDVNDPYASIYWWKREACAKLEAMFLLDAHYAKDDTAKAYKGWKINDAGRYLLAKVEAS